jgi:arylsulfatase/uncharacterized sulfatase
LDLTDKVYWYEDGKEAVMPSDYYSSQFFVDKAIEYIRSGAKEGKPLFAYVAFQANHIPVQAPKEFVDKYKGTYKDGWTALRQARRDKAIALGLIPKDTPMVTMATTSVLPMPEGYEPTRQVLINALVNVYVPRYRNAVLALVAGVVAIAVAIAIRRRRRRAG